MSNFRPELVVKANPVVRGTGRRPYMTRRSTLTAQVVLLLIFSATAARAQEIDPEGPAARAQFCGDDSGNPPAGQVSFDWQSNFIQLSRLGNYYMPYYGDGDSATVPFWENGGADVDYGSDGFHETWYIPRSPLPSGTRLFYRLLNPSWNDHMDSWDQNEGAVALSTGTG